MEPAADGMVHCSEAVRQGLSLLLKALDYAHDVDRDVWDFAVEVDRLAECGITICDMRWLVCKGMVEHQVEIVHPRQPGRNFYAADALRIERQSCFTLTTAGADYCRGLLRQESHEPPGATPKNLGVQTSGELPPPHWDAELRELRVNGGLVKRFKLPSPNQELVLAAFEEDCWPRRIDDPLPPAPNRDPKRRLHDTINSLNRNQKSQLVRFLGDGTGQGVVWTPADE